MPLKMPSPVQHIVKHNRRYLIITIVPTLVLLVVALLLGWLTLVVLLGLISPFFVFVYMKSRLYYSSEGITIHDPIRGTTFVQWKDVVLIEHVYGFPYPNRLGIDSLRIVFNTDRFKKKVIFYDFLTYSGLIELLVFYDSLPKDNLG